MLIEHPPSHAWIVRSSSQPLQPTSANYLLVLLPTHARRTLVLTTHIQPLTMDKALEYSPAVCLRLIDDHASAFDHHCSLCAFLHGNEEECHHQPQQPPKPVNTDLLRSATPLLRTTTPFSDCSFYTAVSSSDREHEADGSTSSSEDSDSLPSLDDSSSLSSRSSTSTLKPNSHEKRRFLRRTASPTDVSLRDLHHQQSPGSSIRTPSRTSSIYSIQPETEAEESATGVRIQQSEEKLQAVYEEQIMSYLNASYADLETIGVAWSPARPGL